MHIELENCINSVSVHLRKPYDTHTRTNEPKRQLKANDSKRCILKVIMRSAMIPWRDSQAKVARPLTQNASISHAVRLLHMYPRV